MSMPKLDPALKAAYDNVKGHKPIYAEPGSPGAALLEILRQYRGMDERPICVCGTQH